MIFLPDDSGLPFKNGRGINVMSFSLHKLSILNTLLTILALALSNSSIKLFYWKILLSEALPSLGLLTDVIHAGETSIRNCIVFADL